MEESGSNSPNISICPGCGTSVDVSAVGPYSAVECPKCSAAMRVREIMGQYQIVGILGEGGMSRVFRAVDMNLGREVALKVLHQALSEDSALTSMFEREAKLTASILHPNVVKVYTVGKDQGYFFIAMEMVAASSLEELIEKKGSLSESNLLSIAHDVISGLRAAYDQNLIHRDIKPGNMLVTDEGTAKLVDFGLAVQQGGEDLSEELWATPFYVPPEKLDGDQDTFLGDIYSLGATFYHALAGKPPFDANSSSIDELKVIKKNAVNLRSAAPRASKPTVQLIEKMMAYRPGDRPDSYDSLLDQIEEIQERVFGKTIASRKSKTSNKLRGGIIGAGVLIAGLAIAIFAQKEDLPIVDPDLGIGEGERLISAGDNSNVETFLKGRGLVSSGDFERSEKLFDKLLKSEELPDSIQIWSLYFAGLSRLGMGNERGARADFADVAAMTPDQESDDLETIEFLRASSLGLASSLPILESEIESHSAAASPIGLFSAGLKNWQLGEFASAVRLFEKFDRVDDVEGYEWISDLKSATRPFLRDMKLLEALPRPTAKAREDLPEQGALFKKTLEKLQTRGEAGRLVQNRLDRIGEIEKSFAEEVAPEPMLPETNLAEANAAEGVADPEREELVSYFRAALSEREIPTFAPLLSKIADRELTSPRSIEAQSDIVAVLEQADRFIPALSLDLNSVGYEGTVRRKVGVPLDAEVTAAGPEVWIIDLGFGPNEVPVSAFSPEWLVEVARPQFAESNAAALLSFALCTGQIGLVDSLVEGGVDLDPEFREVFVRVRSIF